MKNLMERIKEYVTPVRIVLAEGVKNADWILHSKQEQVYKRNAGVMTLKQGGFILLDFGRELQGGLRLITEYGDELGRVGIRIRFGESVGEAMAELFEDNARNDHSPRDMRVCLPRLSDTEWGATGFRFVRIDNESGVDYRFVSIFAAYTHLREEPKGWFKCSDSTVNDIWDTAAHTLFLNMQNRLWDGIKRDRLVWVGDMYPEARGVFSLYGEHPLVELGISESAERELLPAWMCDVPSYSIWWLAILCEYEWFTNQWEFIEKQLPYAYGVIEQFDRCVGANGELDYSPIGVQTDYGFFLNWETKTDEGLEDGNRGLLLWALKSFVRMAKRRKIDFSAAERLVMKLERKRSFNGTSKAVAALYSMGYGEEASAKNLLNVGGVKGYSTFMSLYIAEQTARVAGGKEALAGMKEFYEGMLSRGATSFWESFAPEWLQGSGRIDEPTPTGLKDIHCSFGAYCYSGYRLSLCHGWACGPLPFLSENALGVRFVQPGGQAIRIKPDLMGLDWVEGAFPTAYGLVEVKHKKTTAGVETVFNAPKDVYIIR